MKSAIIKVQKIKLWSFNTTVWNGHTGIHWISYSLSQFTKTSERINITCNQESFN